MMATETLRPGRRAVLVGLAGAALTGFADASPPVELRRLTPAFDRIVAPGTPVEVIATGIQWAEGPLWVPQDGGYLLFSDPPANIVRRWSRGGGVATFLSPSGAPDPDRTVLREPGANGMALDRGGGLLIANSGGRSIDRVDLKTRRRTMLVGRYEGKRFNSPNDVHVARDGAIWFTDPPFGLLKPSQGCPGPQELGHHGLYRLPPDGGALHCMARLDHPNGLAFSPDERVLYVSQTPETGAGEQEIIALDWRDGALHDPRRFAVVPEGLPDGLCVDRQGWLWSSSGAGVCVFDPEGRLLGLVPTPHTASNCSFDQDHQRLFITGGSALWLLELA